MGIKIAFYISIPVTILAIFFLLIFPLIKKAKMRTNFLNVVGKKVTEIAEIKDYLLLNRVILPIDEIHNMHIDHILFGNKYIYLINDQYIEGSLPQAKENDKKWVQLQSLNKPEWIDNPILKNKRRVEKFTLLTRTEPDILVGIIVCNNDLSYNDFLITDSHQHFVKLNQVARLIDSFEMSKNVNNISNEDLKELVKQINKMNKYKPNDENKK